MYRTKVFWLMATGFLALVLVGNGSSANQRANNRCEPVKSGSTLKYNKCWAAYPEGFSVSGYAHGKLSWNVTCSGKSRSGSDRLNGPFVIDVGRVAALDFISHDPAKVAAYKLMVASDVCRVTALISSSGGRVAAELFINQNHPRPAIG